MVRFFFGSLLVMKSQNGMLRESFPAFALILQ